MRQFTPRQRPTDIRILESQKWKSDPQVSVKHDEFFAGAWECEYEKSIFGAGNNSATPPNSRELPVLSHFFNIGNVEHIRTRTRVFPRNFSSKGTIMWRNRYVSRYGTWCGDKLGTTELFPAAPKTNYVITRCLIAMTPTDIKLRAELVRSTERARIRSRKSRNASFSKCVTVQNFVTFCSGYSLATNSIVTQSWLLQNTVTKAKFDYILIFTTQVEFFSSISFHFLFFQHQ